MKEPTTERFIFTILRIKSTTDRFNPTLSRDELTNRSVQSHELEDKLIDGLVWS
jgi:hypothetical protein